MTPSRLPSRVVTALLTRDRYTCVSCGTAVSGDPWDRGYYWSIQHRIARGMGGSTHPMITTIANLIVLCGSGTTGCHGRIESKSCPGDVLAGFSLSRYSGRRGVHTDPSTHPVRHAVHGLVLLDHVGGWTSADVVPV